MIKLENTEVMGWEHAIRGMRNPMNSYDKMDSFLCTEGPMTNEEIDVTCGKCLKKDCCDIYDTAPHFIIGPNDYDLMKRLRNAGTDHRKFMRMITVYVDITAPLYWWKEFDTYKVGTVANSCSTMHKIHAKEFTLEDFSCEHLIDDAPTEDMVKELENDIKGLDDYTEAQAMEDGYFCYDEETGYLAYAVPYDESRIKTFFYSPKNVLKTFIIPVLNANREAYLKTKDKKYWWQMIQLLPSSYNQRRTVLLNYEVLANIYKSRKAHKLDEWKDFCKWIEGLPYSELITGKFDKENENDQKSC